jgi:carboxylesterase type B
MQTPTTKTIAEVAARYPEDPQNPASRFNNFATDVGFACYSQVLSKTFGENAYRYVMSLPPATHELDQQYYFYINEVATPGDIDVKIARQFQQYLRNFIVYGNPNGPVDSHDKRGTRVTLDSSPQDTSSEHNKGGIGASYWPDYWNQKVFNITSNGFEATTDPWSLNGKCGFIQALIDDPANGF